MFLWKKIKNKVFKRKSLSEMPRFKIFNTGFHGDKYFLSLVNKIMLDIDVLIETGANVGTTARYVAKTYQHIKTYSCEPDARAYEQAKKNLAGFSNANLYQMLSPDFLYHLYEEHPQLKLSRTFYWLDAHDYGFKWPLHDEIAYITREMGSGIIFVDDAQVPGHEQFKYCVYGDQICNMDYIENALTSGKTYQTLHPTYTEHTSPHHPLIGYIGIAFGDQYFPDNLIHFAIRDFKKWEA